ncbi:MAG: ABC transporter substrate-binding protein [Lachnospiraceae bacterium]|nr:ABC transporter substrate-binding protein [Lachnospiraceae bacterium]
MRKRLAVLMALGMAAGTLAGCGAGAKQGDVSSEASSAAGKDGKISIEFWHCMGSSNGELIESIVDSFNKSQDKIEVKAVHQGSYTDAGTKMQAALAAGEAPVLAQMEIGMLGIFADADQLVDMQKYVDADKYDIDDFMSGLLDASYYNNALIALPHSRSVPVLYYNKDKFKEAGLDENQPPITWEDLKADSKALTGGGMFGYSCPLDQWYYTALVMNAGGTIFNEANNGIGFNGESGTKPLYLWKEMIADGTMHIPSGQDYNSSEACRNAFAGGTAAMIMQSSAQLKGLEQTCGFSVGVGQIPQDTTLSYPAGGSNLMMFKGHSEEEEKAGWEFLKYMLNTENTTKWASGTGYLPVKKSCLETEEYKKVLKDDPNFQTIVDQVEYCTYKTPFIPQYQEAKEIFAGEIQKCILEDNYTPEQAIKSLDSRVAALFK